MGQKDLGTCVILCKSDIDKLKINIEGLSEIVDDFKGIEDSRNTPVVYGFSGQGVRKKLRTYIEKEARKLNADVALITSQGDSADGDVSYSFSLYQYNSK